MKLGALVLRAATLADIPAIRQLHAASLRRLGRSHYASCTLERMLASGSFQPELLRHGRYKLALLGDQAVGSGGWLDHVGASAASPREQDGSVQRRRHTARVCAVYAAPWLVRECIGSTLLEVIAAEMLAAGKTRATLVSTRMAVRFFSRHGYGVDHPLTVAVAGARLVEVFSMTKTLRTPDSIVPLHVAEESDAGERGRAALPRAA